MNVGDWIKRNGSMILTCLGAGGVISTVVLAIKATPKAMDKIQDAAITKAEDTLVWRREGAVRKCKGGCELPRLTVLETIMACGKEYIPTVAVGTASLVCIFGANVLSRRQQASLVSAYTALASSFEAYREKVELLCGPGTSDAVEKALKQEKRDAEDDRPPWDEVQTFFFAANSHPQFFERTMEQVMQAEYHINRNLILRGYVSLNEFLEFLGLDSVEGGELIGWDQYYGETEYGYRWIDFNHRHYTTDDGLLVCSIETPFEPHPYN